MIEIGAVTVFLVFLLLIMRREEENLPSEQQLEEKVPGISFGNSMLVVALLLVIAFVLLVMIQVG